MGCPIRKSPDQSLLTAPRGLTQPTTSFFGLWRQGIHRVPLIARHHATRPAEPTAIYLYVDDLPCIYALVKVHGLRPVLGPDPQPNRRQKNRPIRSVTTQKTALPGYAPIGLLRWVVKSG